MVSYKMTLGGDYDAANATDISIIDGTAAVAFAGDSDLTVTSIDGGDGIMGFYVNGTWTAAIYPNVTVNDAGWYLDYASSSFKASFFGGEYGDVLIGGSNTDTLIGGRGRDTLIGNDGSDVLIGGYGDDSIDGGTGMDSMFVRGGHDTLIFRTGDTGGTKGLADQVYGFNGKTGERVDLSHYDGNENKAHHQDFSFIGSDRFHGTAGELRFSQSDGETYLYGDTDGDKKADMIIHFDGLVNLKDHYFLF